jgi:hypothetical protein
MIITPTQVLALETLGYTYQEVCGWTSGYAAHVLGDVYPTRRKHHATKPTRQGQSVPEVTQGAPGGLYVS